jgi:hypothetical protein
MPVCGRNLANKAVRYLEAVKEGYRRRLGGDSGYAGVLTKNPHHPHWLVERGHQKLWSLSELAEYVALPSSRDLLLGQQPDFEVFGRNVATFDRLRFWAYKAVDAFRHRGRGRDSWAEAVAVKAHQLNELNAPPLDHGELRHIVRSVAVWVWLHYDGSGGAFNELASQLGKLGGRPKTTTKSGLPWVDEGTSRATWYRDQKANRQAFGK